MAYTKKSATVSPLLKYSVLSLYVILPIITFLLGIKYQQNIFKSTKLNSVIFTSPTVSPTVFVKQQPPPYGKVTIQGTVDVYDSVPAYVDGAATLHVLENNGVLFDIMLPAGESSCPISVERNDTLGKLKKGDHVEIYGTAATNDRIIVCYADEYVKILTD